MHSIRRVAATSSAFLLVLALVVPARSATERVDNENDEHMYDTTLLGVDSNGNWVRDDLEAILNARFGEDKRGLRVMTNLLTSFQYALIATNAKESQNAHTMYLNAMACAEGLSREYPKLDGYGLIDLSQNLANTNARYTAMKEHFQRVEEMHLVTEIAPTWSSACMRKYDTKGLAGHARR